MDSDDRSDFMLFVGAADWTRDSEETEGGADMYVEISVDGAREVHRTMYAETSLWDEKLKITGHLSSIVSIEIKSVSHNSSESLSVARADASLGHLLDICADGDAALEITMAPLASDMLEKTTGADCGKASKYSTTDSMGFITLGLSRLPHDSPNLLDVYIEPMEEMGKLKERITEGAEIVPAAQACDVGTLVSSFEESAQTDTKNLASTGAIMDSNDRLDFMLFVGTAEWTRDPDGQGEDSDLCVEVSVDGLRQVHRTLYTKNAVWDENLKITGHLSSIVSIEIKSEAHKHPESLTVARADASLGHLLDTCADGDAALEITMAPLVSNMLENATNMTDDEKASKHSNTDRIGFMTLKLSRLPHEPPSLLQLPDVYIEPMQEMGELEERITEVDIVAPIQDNNVGSSASVVQSEHPIPEHPACADAVINPDERSSFLLYVDAAEWTRDSEEQGEDADMYVEVSVDGAREVHRTMHTQTASWGQDIKITGCLSSVITIVVKSVSSSESFSMARAESRLGHLLESCEDDDSAALELTVAPLASGLIDQVIVTEGPKDSEPSAPGTIGFITVKLCRLPHDTRGRLQLPDTSPDPTQQTGELEGRITEDVEARGWIDDDIIQMAVNISRLGLDCIKRFDQLGELADLESAIEHFQQAVALTPDGHPLKPRLLIELSDSYDKRLEQLGDLADLENSITSREEAVALVPNDDLEKPIYLSNLGSRYAARFKRLGDFVDLAKSIVTFREAITLTPDGHPHISIMLANLGTSYTVRFERHGVLADLENAIASREKAIALVPNDHLEKQRYLSNLASNYFARFERLGDLTDLEKSIAMCQEAVTLATDPPAKVQDLSNLGNSYCRRFQQFGDLGDLEKAIVRYEDAIALSPDGPNKPAVLTNLGIGYLERFERLGDLADLENSISSSKEAVALTPDGHPSKALYLSNLGSSYNKRFQRLGDLIDLERSIASWQEANTLTPVDHPDKPKPLSNLGAGYNTRFEWLGVLANLENSITSFQEAITLTPNGDLTKPDRLLNLGSSYIMRFERTRDLGDLNNAIASLEEALTLNPGGGRNKSVHLSTIGIAYRERFEQLKVVADFENSISSQRQAVTLTPDDHPEKPARFINLVNIYWAGYKHYHNKSYLSSALSFIKLAAQSPGGTPRRLLQASRRWASLSLASGDIPSALQALRTAIETLPQIAWLGLNIASRQNWLTKEEPEELGCMAATCAIWLGKYEEAVELLDMARSVFWQQASSVRSDLQDLKARHAVLAEDLETVSKRLDASAFSGLSAASLDTQLYDRRLAEHRQLVLRRESSIKEIRSLPGFEFFLKPKPFDLLREAASAGRVVIINISNIAADAIVFDCNHPIRHVPLPQVDVANSFKYSDDIQLKKTRAGDTEDAQHSLTLPEVWESTDVDMLNPSFRSPHWTSGRNTNFTIGGIEHRDARADVTEERQRSLTLPRIWAHILKPIFTEIGIPLQRSEDQVPTNRILWYLTGPLTFTPIHAAGPVNQSVSELVVSSYVTTLSSLAEAQKRQSQPLSGPTRLLAIAQPDTPGQMPIPYSTLEVDTVVKTVSTKGWPGGHLQRFDSAQATVGQVSDALDTCSWVHFACHATQHPSDGMESAIVLYDERLRLSLIAAKRLPSARFAFLSTCQSAAGKQDSPGEAMHLSAGMQFAGFSSVIATMWSIRDEDAPIIAEHTYTYLLRNGLDKVDLTEAAAALHYAVSRLREDPNVTVERWAPFVYYGV